MKSLKAGEDEMASIIAAIPTAAAGKPHSLPPVHLWNPPYCGDIGLLIRRDGTWWQDGGRFTREALVRLFSTILRMDEDGKTYLVTPAEKILIRVEDVPFIATRVDREGTGPGQILRFLTNVGDEAIAGPEHPIRVVTDPHTLEPAPYILVRGRLEARLARPAFYEMTEWAEERDTAEGPVLGVWSQNVFFPLGPAGAHLDEAAV